MKATRRLLISLFLAALVGVITPMSALAATIPNLGNSASFAVLAAAGITNSGPTTITGDVGTFPTTSETGFGSVTITPGGTNHAGDAVTQLARTDETAAYNDLANQTPCPVQAGGTLDGLNLTPGCYKFSSSAILNVGQVLTLSGFGVYVFQIGTSLTIGNGTTINLINGAVACGLFWQVHDSATIGLAPTNFQGTLIAGTSISVNTGAVWTGRAFAGALAPSGAVTLLSNTITRPAAACAGLPVTGLPRELRGGLASQLILIGVVAGAGALLLVGINMRARRRRTS